MPAGSRQRRKKNMTANNRYVQITLNKVSMLLQTGNSSQAADLLAEIMVLHPEITELAQARETLILDVVKAAEELQEAERLDDALHKLMGLFVFEKEHEYILASLRNALVRQIWQDQKRDCAEEALRLGRKDLIPSQGPSQKIADASLMAVARYFAGSGQPALADTICNYLQERGLSCSGLFQIRTQLRHFFEGPRLSADSSTTGRGFLLIKSWGTGFWSEVDNLIGNLLLAEITGRIPVIDWGANNLFCDDPGQNAFEHFFEPLNNYDAKKLAAGEYSYFPPKWNRGNVTSSEVNKLHGSFSRLPGLYFLNRREEVLVSDYFVAVNELAGYIRPDHRFFGLTVEELYRTLFRQYLRLKPEIISATESFRNRYLTHDTILAVHVRASDKITEDANLPIINQLYPTEIDLFLQQYPDARFFLITDSVSVVTEFSARYGSRVISAPCRRTASDLGTHFQPAASRWELGFEVIRDVLLAAQCTHFLGYGLSSVSCAVLYLNEWTPGRCRVFGAKSTEMKRLAYYTETDISRFIQKGCYP